MRAAAPLSPTRLALRTLVACGMVALLPRCEADPEPTCVAPLSASARPAAEAPLRRLTPREYHATVRDLLGFPSTESVARLAPLPPDPPVDDFENDAATQTPSPYALEQYAAAARRFADVVERDASVLAPCDDTTGDAGAACGVRFALAFGARAFRRPVTGAEVARFGAFFPAAVRDHGYARAVGMFVEATLQSPSFLYRPEVGSSACAASKAVPVDGYELASRLSYFLWGSMPDAELFDAAAHGDLATEDAIAAQAHRMLGDPRAHEAVAEFHRQWLGLSMLVGQGKDGNAFPYFDFPMLPVLEASARAYLDDVFWQRGGTVRALLTDTRGYVAPIVAPAFNLGDPSVRAPGTELSRVMLDPSQRAGFLTQPALLFALAHERDPSPVRRGVYVLRRFLCAPPSPPPPGVGALASGPSTGNPTTNRMRLEAHLADDGCRGCHAAIDGIGFGFEAYDAMGRFRTTDDGLPVDATGELHGAGSADGPFDGAIELSKRLAESEVVRACVVRKWFRFAFGRLETEGDATTIAALEAAFEASGGDMRALMITIATSEAFRTRGPRREGATP